MSMQTTTANVVNLQIGQEDPVLEAKVYRKWIAKNPLETKEHAFCCILIDRECHAIQATMDLRDLRMFDSKLKTNAAYRITNFICEPTNPYMQTLDNRLSLSFGRITTFVELSGKQSEFPDHYFEFTSYGQLPSRIPYQDQQTTKMVYPRLTDYLGCIRSISDLIPFGATSTGRRARRNVAIEDLDQNIVELTIWGDLATHFNKEEYDKIPFPAIIAVTSCTVSRYRGTPQLAATSATHYYINPKTEEAATMYRMFKEKYATKPPLPLKIYRSNNLAEETERNRQTLATLTDQNPTSLQNVRFTCEAMVTDIISNRSWNYPSCTECNNASTKVGPSYVCKNHGKHIPTPYRYNFKATATDGTANAEFTFFTEAGEKITGISCSELKRKYADAPQLGLPKELTNVIGKKHIFQIQFAHGSQKGTGRFIVQDILDITHKPREQLPDIISTATTNKEKKMEGESTTSMPLAIECSTTDTSKIPGTPSTDLITAGTTTTTPTSPTTNITVQQQKQVDTTATPNLKDKRSSTKRSLEEDLSREAKKKKDN